MSLDEAIKYYNHLADENRRKADIERNDYMDLKDLTTECEQLADWLNELKVLREKIQKLLEKQEQDGWIPVTERLPKCEQEVLICTKEKTYIHEKSGFEWCVNSIVTPAIYEDGTMLEVNSKWHWEDCDWAGWDEEEDCGIIPEGWWENRQFNPDGEYNHAIDVEVLAWRPLPEAYTEEE